MLSHKTTDQTDSTLAHFGGFSAADSARLINTMTSHAAPDLSTAAKPTSPTLTQEVGFVNGLNPDGTINSNSYWGNNGTTAHKWGASTAGTSGGVVTYTFDKNSAWTAQEKSTWVKGMTLWSSVADIQFKEVKSGGDVLYKRGHDGGAYTSEGNTQGHGSTIGSVTGTPFISIDTSVAGFELNGSFDKYGGYGLSSVVHELGHLIGLGHGGDYNGNVDPKTQQFSAYDDRMYTIMSYIYYGEEGNSKYGSQNPVQGTDWGTTVEGIDRQAPHTMMGLDILATQQLYGVSTHSPFTGGQTYGFNSNITGVLHDFYDFTVNTHPVVTIYNQGLGNTLDLSGYTAASTVSLVGGSFSSMNGMSNNLFIDFSTQINHAITGSGNDKLIANGFGDILEAGGGADTLASGAGNDTMTGGSGNDKFYFVSGSATDEITDFTRGQDKIQISVKGVKNFSDLTIGSDGHGGAMVSWKGGASVDVDGVSPNALKATDFAFGALSGLPANIVHNDFAPMHADLFHTGHLAIV